MKEKLSKEQITMDDLKVELTDDTKKGLNGLREFIGYWDNDLKPFVINTIQVALPYYLQLSQITQDIERFVATNNIVAIVDEENGIKEYKYSDDKPLKEADEKVLKALSKQTDKIYDEVIKNKIAIDFMAVHFLSEMMHSVDNEIMSFRNPSTKMVKVFGNFSDDEYYKIVFAGKEDCPEAQNYKEIAKKIDHAFTLLKNVK